MTKNAWTDIARSLARLRAKLLEHGGRSDRAKALHAERIIGVDLAARAICRTLKKRSTRFDSRRFMEMTKG